MPWKNAMKVSKWKKGKARRRRATAKPRQSKASTNRKVDVRVKLKKSIVAGVAGSSIPSAGYYAYAAVSAINTDYLSVTQLTEHQLHAKMYDEYCVKSVSVKYVPSITAGQDGMPMQVNPIMYSWIDWDGKTPISTSFDAIEKLNAYDSCRKTSIYKSVTRSFRPKKTHYLDSNHTYSPAAEATRMDGLDAVIGFYGQNLPVNAGTNLQIGTFEITYDVAYRGKKPTAFTIDANGSVTVYEAEAYPPLATTVVSTLASVNDVDPHGL